MSTASASSALSVTMSRLVAVVQRGGRVDQQGDVGVGGGGDAARDGGLGQPRADRRRRVAHGRAVVEFERGAVGKGDVQGHAGGPFSACAPAHLAGAVASASLADERGTAVLRPRRGTTARRVPSIEAAASRRPAMMRACSSCPGASASTQSLAPAKSPSATGCPLRVSRMMYGGWARRQARTCRHSSGPSQPGRSQSTTARSGAFGAVSRSTVCDPVPDSTGSSPMPKGRQRPCEARISKWRHRAR